MLHRKFRAFTLIELLIVVAIIAILAAIAVPNFLEAQVRSKVAREKSNMRTVATALESYRVDGTQYPPDNLYFALSTTRPIPFLGKLTTPIAYLSSLPEAVFYNKYWKPSDPAVPDGVELYEARQYGYANRVLSAEPWFKALLMALYGLQPNGEFSKEWVISTLGPDFKSNQGWYAVFGEDFLNKVPGFPGNTSGRGCFYDATNGTISEGDLIRVGP